MNIQFGNNANAPSGQIVYASTQGSRKRDPFYMVGQQGGNGLGIPLQEFSMEDMFIPQNQG